MSQDIFSYPVQTIQGEQTTLAPFKGKVLLIVNVASKCGFTPQYTGLEKLHKDLSPKGFEVLGFPCNQFGAQEPGDEKEIQNFCKLTYDVSFPMFAKVDVNGSDTHPLWDHLKKNQKGILGTEAIKWNFTKFLIGKDGSVLKRFAPQDTPEKIRSEIEKFL